MLITDSGVGETFAKPSPLMIEGDLVDAFRFNPLYPSDISPAKRGKPAVRPLDGRSVR